MLTGEDLTAFLNATLDLEMQVKRAASDPKLLDLLFKEYNESHNNN